ncbi:SufE family protein [bacterium]|nr:SufE family protein [bacterium]
MTINQAQDEIIEEMDSLNNQMEKYNYLIEQANWSTSADTSIRTEENLISACQSRVWLDVEVNDGVMIFRADSDAQITKGIINLLIRVLNNQTPSSVLDADLYVLDKTGLASTLSPSRTNGLQAILKRIQQEAEQHR